MNEQRYLLVVSGPSGVGKDTVVGQLLHDYKDIELSVSATTRAPREGEKDGVHYHFVSQQTFDEWLQNGDLLESTCYNGNCYGTPKAEVDKRIKAGITVVLVIEVEGMANVKRIYPDSTAVFIMPPSEEELERRLRKRGSEEEAQIQARLAVAKRELALADTYDYQLVNNSPATCAAEMYGILKERQQQPG